MEIVRRNLVLKFETENGSEIDLKVLRPMDGLDGSDIKAAMDTIVTSGAYGSKSPATKVVGAQYDIRQIEEVELV